MAMNSVSVLSGEISYYCEGLARYLHLRVKSNSEFSQMSYRGSGGKCLLGERYHSDKKIWLYVFCSQRYMLVDMSFGQNDLLPLA